MKHEYVYTNRGFIDRVDCTCGWDGHEYWDGFEWAYEAWLKHKKESEEPE